MKKKLIILTLLLFLATPITVFAEPSNEEITESQEIEDAEDTETETKEEMEDEIKAIPSSEMKSSDLNTCQITFKAIIPERFGLDCKAELINEDGLAIEIPLYASNDYTERFFVPQGKYTVSKVGVWGDNAGEYPMTYPEKFIINDGDTKLLETTLVNYSEIYEKIKNKVEDVENICVKCAAPLNEQKNCSNPDCEYYVEPVVTISTEKESDFEVIHSGTGTGTMTVTGTPTNEFFLVFRIAESGTLGTSTVEISTDNGVNFASPATIPLSGILESAGSGLNFTFSGDFVKGDTYSIFIPDPAKEIRFSTDLTTDEIELSVPNGYVYDILNDNYIQFVLKIKKGGIASETIFKVSLDGGKTWLPESYIPENREYVISELGLSVLFPGNKYTDNATYRVVTELEQPPNYTLVIIIFSVLFVLILVALLYLKSKQRKESEYKF